jgi:hypothetical protein
VRDAITADIAVGCDLQYIDIHCYFLGQKTIAGVSDECAFIDRELGLRSYPRTFHGSPFDMPRMG